MVPLGEKDLGIEMKRSVVGVFGIGAVLGCVGAVSGCQTLPFAGPTVLPADSDRVVIGTAQDWAVYAANIEGLVVEGDGISGEGVFTSQLIALEEPAVLGALTVTQSADWADWRPVPQGKAMPSTLRDAPVLVTVDDGEYWLLGRRPRNASGEPSLGGYHAWRSSDMQTWTHYGPVTDHRSRWVTTAEYVDGAFYIYYDYPNDQDPSVFVDRDLTDGQLGEDLGVVFDDPTHGSDVGVLRDLDGRVHMFFEDWSPLDASKQSWDSPVAGHAIAERVDGVFSFVNNAVDLRTTPTGRVGTYRHPHWKQHPDWDSNIGEYEVHTPKQDAFGDWTAIRVGDHYYLFGDYDPADAVHVRDGGRGSHMKVGRFVSTDVDGAFEFLGAFGSGHPDPTIGFAAGQFYLLTQTAADYVSDGPWVDGVRVRVGVDASGDGAIDAWTAWTQVKERYSRAQGYTRVVEAIPASLDLSDLPEAHGFVFELKLETPAGGDVTPTIDLVEIALN